MTESLWKISGGYVYDPLHDVDGQVQDVWIRGSKIVEPPDDPEVRAWDAAARSFFGLPEGPATRAFEPALAALGLVPCQAAFVGHDGDELAAAAELEAGDLRISEALALKPKDLDADSGTVRILAGKGNKARTVGLAGR